MSPKENDVGNELLMAVAMGSWMLMAPAFLKIASFSTSIVRTPWIMEAFVWLPVVILAIAVSTAFFKKNILGRMGPAEMVLSPTHVQVILILVSLDAIMIFEKMLSSAKSV